jgi:hypothetical protein
MKVIQVQYGQSRATANLVGEGRLARSTTAHDGYAFHQYPPYSSRADTTGFIDRKTESKLKYRAKVKKGEL